MGKQYGDWETQIAQVWATAGERSGAAVLAAVAELVHQRPAGDAAALFEQASAWDFADREAEAEPLYRQALAASLDAYRRPRAVIQLASTLRNLDRAAEGAALLEQEVATALNDGLDDARAAFLVLALVDSGRTAEAAACALAALAPHLPEYNRAVSHYASELVSQRAAGP